MPIIRRKIIPKDTARQWLADVCVEKVFYCRDGRVLKNLHELSAALRTMTVETFNHHVTADRNDFSNWIKDVIGDETLAEDLRNAEDKADATRRLEERLAQLRTRAWTRDKL